MILALLFACTLPVAKDSTPDSHTGGGDDTSLAACETLSVADCDTRADCTPLQAGAISIPDPGGCFHVDALAPVSCVPVDTSCGAAITYAYAPSGDGPCYQFRSTCWPTDWVACTTDFNDMLEC